MHERHSVGISRRTDPRCDPRWSGEVNRGVENGRASSSLLPHTRRRLASDQWYRLSTAVPTGHTSELWLRRNERRQSSSRPAAKRLRGQPARGEGNGERLVCAKTSNARRAEGVKVNATTLENREPISPNGQLTRGKRWQWAGWTFKLPALKDLREARSLVNESSLEKWQRTSRKERSSGIARVEINCQGYL